LMVAFRNEVAVRRSPPKVAGFGCDVLTSEATRALSTGAGLKFEDRSVHQLKGLDEQRRLFAFVATT
jgi:hypothetical protein